MIRRILSIFLLILTLYTSLEAKLPKIQPKNVNEKVQEMLKAHASHKELSPELIRRTLKNYLEELDPNKTYFIEVDINQWLNPTDQQLQAILNDYNKSNFSTFEQIHDKMTMAINRRREIDKNIDWNNLPEKVNAAEFKDMKWAANVNELQTRITRIKSLQKEASTKLDDDFKDKALQRIAKNQNSFEEEVLNSEKTHRNQLILSNILKATAGSLDSHTSYFTPGEASQFMISVQQRLFGIGALLRDDLNGFTLQKIIEGGPAAQGKELKAKDRIIAVDGEPVVGMDITDAVELIRGKEGTPVLLRIIRETGEGDDKMEEQLEIEVIRGEVVIKESRYESSHDPFGDGVIGYIKLNSFYQDPEYSSTVDLKEEIQKLKKEHNVKGLILDLRYNSGGMLSQAVGVTGLFIKKGIVVGIKDNTGAVQYLRNLEEGMTWDGPLIVLINRASASASEIVAQTLQDYGRAIVIGDDHTFGKGSFQTFTLQSTQDEVVDEQGEYKVTRGRYYTVSGKTPQLTGVFADVIVPGALSEMEIGEKFSKYPLENDSLKPNYEDDLSDIPFVQRQKIRSIYKHNLQTKLDTYQPYLDNLKANSAYRIEKNKNYQTFLKEIKKDNSVEGEAEAEESFGQNDLQLIETYNIMKDLIMMMDSPKTKWVQSK